MSDRSFLKEIEASIESASELYYRLVLVVFERNESGIKLMETQNLHCANVGLRLAELLMELPARRRPFEVEHLLRAIVEEGTQEVLVLDNLEILFDESLMLDPLVVLQRLSRSRTIVALWRGRVEAGNLVYSEPGHVEYRSFSTRDLFILDTNSKTDKPV